MIPLHTKAEHLLYLICSIYPSSKYFRVLRTGFGSVCPNPHMEASMIAWDRSSRVLRSSSLPSPRQILLSMSSSSDDPSRQEAHFPQDSSLVKTIKYFATSTTQVSSSITISPPDPIIEPASVNFS